MKIDIFSKCVPFVPLVPNKYKTLNINKIKRNKLLKFQKLKSSTCSILIKSGTNGTTKNKTGTFKFLLQNLEN